MGFKLGDVFKNDEESLIIDRKKQAIKALIIFTIIVSVILAGLIALQNIGDVDENRRKAITKDIISVQLYVKDQAAKAKESVNYVYPGFNLNTSGEETAYRLRINGIEEEYRYGYYLLTPNDYKDDMALALNETNEAYIVNYSTADVINITGVKYENGRYHSIDDLLAIKSITEGTRVDIPSRKTYIIKTPEDMNLLRQYPNANFKLAANIDMSAYQSGQGWEPVQSFTGSFDGRGYTIYNLKIARQTQSYVGLFGNVNGGSIRNLTLRNVDIDGENYTGALAGTMYGRISNIIIEGGNVRGNDNVGALVGANQGTITMCRVNIGHVSGNNNVGGAVGTFNSGTLDQILLTVDSVNANSGVGGFVGRATATNTAELSECVAVVQTRDEKAEIRSGGILGNNDIGGLIGCVEIMNAYGLNVKNSYAIGNINEGVENKGGIIGRLRIGAQGSFGLNSVYAAVSILEKGETSGGCIGLLDASINSAPNVNYVFWEKNLAPGEVLNNVGKSATATTINFSSKNVEEMMTRSTFTNWDFDVWDIRNYSSRPFLKFERTFVVYN